MACKFFRRGQHAQCTAEEHVIPSLLEQAVFCFNEYTKCPFYLHFYSSPFMKKEMQNAMDLSEKNTEFVSAAKER